MANKPKNKMPISERAKQFMPFSPLRGLETALEKKEKELAFVPRIELLDDEIARLDATLAELEPGTEVLVKYYDDGEYVTISGTVYKISIPRRLLFLADEVISFDDLYNIEII